MARQSRMFAVQNKTTGEFWKAWNHSVIYSSASAAINSWNWKHWEPETKWDKQTLYKLVEVEPKVIGDYVSIKEKQRLVPLNVDTVLSKIEAEFNVTRSEAERLVSLLGQVFVKP